MPPIPWSLRAILSLNKGFLLSPGEQAECVISALTHFKGS